MAHSNQGDVKAFAAVVVTLLIFELLLLLSRCPGVQPSRCPDVQRNSHQAVQLSRCLDILMTSHPEVKRNRQIAIFSATSKTTIKPS
jgi:hypothetical protein